LTDAQNAAGAQALHCTPYSHVMLTDKLIGELDLALRTLAGIAPAARALPQAFSSPATPALSAQDQAESARLMRVNHVGEVCAQALYQGHAAATADEKLAAFFRSAAAEERDHLAWTQARIAALGGRTSLLNPLWYAGAFALGFVAGKVSDPVSLGLMQETEAQVEAHLDDHLQRLPAGDVESRAVLEAMRTDEIAHGQSAQDKGSVPLPQPVKEAMRLGAKVMTSTAYYI
jgi:ubiquinone biosynthesis monooxygenase Coq7